MLTPCFNVNIRHIIWPFFRVRADLIEQLAQKYPQLMFKDVDLAVHVILDEMAQSMCKGDRIEVRGFGSFGINYRPLRNGSNPKTGTAVMVHAKYTPHLKVGKGAACEGGSESAIQTAYSEADAGMKNIVLP